MDAKYLFHILLMKTKRLVITFGLIVTLRQGSFFFHNANSIIRHEALYPDLFNEQVSNIEDRVWAKSVLDQGWKTYYSARSSEALSWNTSKERLLRTSGTADILNQIELSYRNENPKSYIVFCALRKIATLVVRLIT